MGRLMGSKVDVGKLWACMTLFLRADPEGRVFDWQAVLDKYFEGEVQGRTDDELVKASRTVA